jgi:hypothetical protein
MRAEVSVSIQTLGHHGPKARTCRIKGPRVEKDLVAEMVSNPADRDPISHLDLLFSHLWRPASRVPATSSICDLGEEMGDRYGGRGGGGGNWRNNPNFMGQDSNPLSITAMTSTSAPTSTTKLQSGKFLQQSALCPQRGSSGTNSVESKGGSASRAERGSYLDSKPGGAANNSERAGKLESGSESESGSFCKSYFCNKFNSVRLGDRRRYCKQP